MRASGDTVSDADIVHVDFAVLLVLAEVAIVALPDEVQVVDKLGAPVAVDMIDGVTTVSVEVRVTELQLLATP